MMKEIIVKMNLVMRRKVTPKTTTVERNNVSHNQKESIKEKMKYC